MSSGDLPPSPLSPLQLTENTRSAVHIVYDVPDSPERSVQPRFRCVACCLICLSTNRPPPLSCGSIRALFKCRPLNLHPAKLPLDFITERGWGIGCGRGEAEGWLHSLSSADEAWGVIWGLIDPIPENTATTQLYAANLLLHKLRSGPSPDPDATLRKSIILALHFSSSGAGPCAAQLCSGVAALAIRGVPGASVVPWLLGAVGECSDGYVDSVRCSVTLRLLGSLPEELYRDTDRGQHEATHSAWEEAMVTELCGSVGPVLELVREHLERPKSAETFTLAAQCLSNWLTYKLARLDIAYPTLEPLLQGLTGGVNVFDATVDCLETVAVSYELAERPELLSQVALVIRHLGQVLTEFVRTDRNDSRAAPLCNIICRFVETNLSTFLNPEIPGALDQLFGLLDFVHLCSRYHGQFPTEEQLSDVALKLWHSLVFKLVESPHADHLRGVFTSKFVALISTMRSKILLPAEPLDNDDALTFDAYRKEIGEAVGMICFFVKQPIVQELHRLLVMDIQDAVKNPFAYGHIESTLSLLTQAATLLSVCNCDSTIENIFGVLPQIQGFVPALRGKANFIGQMAGWLGNRGDAIQPAATMIMELLSVDGVTSAAAAALAELCETKHSAQHLLPLLPLLCGPETDFSALLMSAGNSAVAIAKSVTLLSRLLDTTEAVHAQLINHILPYVAQLAPAVAQPQMRCYLPTMVKACGAIIDALDQDGDEMLPFETFRVVWPGIKCVFRTMPEDTVMMEATTECLLHAAESSPTLFREVIYEVVSECVIAFERGFAPTILTIISKPFWCMLLKTHGGRSAAAEVYGRLSTSVSRVAMSELATTHYGMFASYFGFLDETLRKDLGGLNHDSMLAESFQLAAKCISCMDRKVIKAASKFIIRLVSVASHTDLAARTVQAGLPILVQHLLQGVAFDVERSVLVDLALVFEYLSKEYYEGYARNVALVLQQMDRASVSSRETLASVLLQNPLNHAQCKDALGKFAKSTRQTV